MGVTLNFAFVLFWVDNLGLSEQLYFFCYLTVIIDTLGLKCKSNRHADKLNFVTKLLCAGPPHFHIVSGLVELPKFGNPTKQLFGITFNCNNK